MKQFTQITNQERGLINISFFIYLYTDSEGNDVQLNYAVILPAFPPFWESTCDSNSSSTLLAGRGGEGSHLSQIKPRKIQKTKLFGG